MNRYSKLIFIALAVTTFFACNKKDNDTTVNSVQYTVNGLADIQVTQYRDTSFSMAVGMNYVSGNQETVTLRVDEVPANCTVTPVTISGIPTFATLLNFHVQALTAGNLPVKISVTSASGITKSYSFNLVSTANTSCRDLFLDTFNVVDSFFFKTSGSFMGINTNAYVGQAVTYNAGKFILGSDTINFNCDINVVTIDSITYPNGSYHTRGTGTRTTNRLDYEYIYFQRDAPDLMRVVRHAVRQ
jgi:hypothetical protein